MCESHVINNENEIDRHDEIREIKLKENNKINSESPT